MSHAITVRSKLVVEKHLYAEPEFSHLVAFRVSGTPADCTNLAVVAIMPDYKPDLILSGINRGNNAGVNVLQKFLIIPSISRSFIRELLRPHWRAQCSAIK
jgi:5'-nucleotidase